MVVRCSWPRSFTRRVPRADTRPAASAQASILLSRSQAGQISRAARLDGPVRSTSNWGFQMIGQLVGNYRIVQLRGEGGMGAVYLAEHPGIGRKAAVKVLHPAYAAEQEFVGRFFNEARAANATRHPGIVEIFDFGTLPSGAPYIIMELLEGEGLAARLKRGGGRI